VKGKYVIQLDIRTEPFDIKRLGAQDRVKMTLKDIERNMVMIRLGPQNLPAVLLRLEGYSPLLMSSTAAMGAFGSGARPLPEEDAAPRAWRMANGDLGFPANNVRLAIAAGGKGNGKVGRQGLESYLKEKIVMDLCMLPLLRDGAPITDYRVDVQRVVVDRKGISRGRPAIDPPWSLTCAVAWDINSKLVSEHVKHGLWILEAAQQAGALGGLGEFRGPKGSYGRFEAFLA
jgi:hypothetical protein